MNVYFTYDYEMFFGTNHGTVEKTLLIPTEKILSIGRRTDAKFTFFIDSGFLLKLKEYSQRYPQLKEEYHLLSKQIQKMHDEGHDCQLHIHPHWEKTIFNGEKWVFDYSFYKLSDFTDNEIENIFKRYKGEIEQIIQKKINGFRAGGWCIQPFNRIQSSFEKNEILIDSSVFVGGKNTVSPYYYDYTNAPQKDCWHFSNNVCKEDPTGEYIELPISSYKYSPFFFFRLFSFGNLFPKNHKPIGDGKPMPSTITRKVMLTKHLFLSANSDGYFVTKIPKILKRNKKKGFQHTVILGHPKATTIFALNKMEKIIRRNKNWCNFIPISKYNVD